MGRHVQICDRFWSKVSISESGCWEWTARRDSDGYGAIRAFRRGLYFKAHRLAYQMVVGPIPAGLVIDHLCRNRGCVNPAHMEVVTIRENTLRGASNSAQNARKTMCRNGHPFDERNTYVGTNRGRPVRSCRQCNASAVAKYNAKRIEVRT